ncbi:MAG: MlaC/ttg2D family ABC transporter substrate-binding protein [Syntrophobacteraceae bacterium]
MTAVKILKVWSINRILILSLLISFICLGSFSSTAVAANNPQAVIQNGTTRLISLLKQYPLESPSLRVKVRTILDNYFDFRAIAKNTLGPEWRRQPPAKREQFTKYFTRLLFKDYLGKVKKYAAQSIAYALVEQGPTSALVRAYVSGAQNLAPISVDFYLHPTNGNWKVYDIVTEGVGLATSYRAQFSSILANSSFDALLRHLKAKDAKG